MCYVCLVMEVEWKKRDVFLQKKKKNMEYSSEEYPADKICYRVPCCMSGSGLDDGCCSGNLHVLHFRVSICLRCTWHFIDTSTHWPNQFPDFILLVTYFVAFITKNCTVLLKDAIVKVKWSRYRPGVAQRVGRGIALFFHDRGTRRRWVVSSTPRPHFTPRKTRFPLYRRLGGPQGRSGRAENLASTGIRSRTVQPVVSRYTDWATGPTKDAIYSQLNWAILLCDVIPDGKAE